MNQPQGAVAALVLNALVWGVSWWPLRLLEQHGLHPLWTTAAMYALVLLGLLLRYAHALADFWRYPALWGLVLASGLTNVGFNWAVTIGDVVRVVLLFYLMPAWAVLLAWLLLRERPSGAALLRLGLALLGVMIVLKSPDSPWPVPSSLADGLALLGGFCFALTNVLLRRLKDTPTEARMLAMFAGGSLLAALTALGGMTVGRVSAPPALAADALVVLLLTSLAFMFANLALQYGTARLPSATTSLVMLTEVVFASVSSVLLGAAELQLRTLVGGGLILLAALWAAWPERAMVAPRA